MFELWIYEGGKAKRVSTARHLGTLKVMWRPHRDAVIALDGVIFDHKDNTDPAAYRAIRCAIDAAPVVIAQVSDPDGPELSRDDTDDRDTPFDDDTDDTEGFDGCPVPDFDRAPEAEAIAEELKTFAHELALGPELATTPLATPCAARGCAGRVGAPTPSPELAAFCTGHRGVIVRGAKRLGVPFPDAACALRLLGAVTRAAVALVRAA